MATIRFTEDIHPISDLKTRAAAILEHLRRSRRPVLLTRRGRGVAVLLDVVEYEKLADRTGFLEAVERGRHAAAEGDLHPHEEAVGILDSFGKDG